jgi:hypothetical protein
MARTRTLLASLLLPCLIPACAPSTPRPAPRDPVLYRDDFTHGLSNWSAELQSPGTLSARDGQLTIDVPAGCTLWFKPLLTSPVLIEYDATVISQGGPNDRVSDLNCFWMARDARAPADLFATHRTGAFADYNLLKTYYIGLGGNSNTTTRFRRYIGHPTRRPLLPEHDLRDPADLIRPNVPTHIKLVADNRRIEFWRDGRRVFSLDDPAPYTSGWFAFRTVHNHMTVRNFVVRRPSRP